jgi:hypothetical protein
MFSEEDLKKNVSFRRPIPLKHMEPHGHLPHNTEAMALWWFIVCAIQALERVPSQKTLEGTEDQQVDLMQVAHSVRKLYGLDTLEGMFQERLIGLARLEAFRSRLPWNDKLDAFFLTGGQSYRKLDRDPDKV